MKSYFKLSVLLMAALLSAQLFRFAYAFLARKEQPIAKIQNQALTEAASRANDTAPPSPLRRKIASST